MQALLRAGWVGRAQAAARRWRRSTAPEVRGTRPAGDLLSTAAGEPMGTRTGTEEAALDGIAAVESRIAMIRSSLGSLRPPTTVVPAGTLAPATGRSAAAAPGPSSASRFASVLATEVSGTRGAAASAPSATSAPSAPSAPSATSATSATPVAGLGATQLDNAGAIVAAGRRLGLSLRDQAIGVMTAMGESSLRVLDHGDKAGPDSRGLFQQRDNGAWGTLAQRMDPTASATSFFTALARVGGRDAMAPTEVAHTVQRNADPQHYARYWDDAVAVVSHLTGATAAQVTGR